MTTTNNESDAVGLSDSNGWLGEFFPRANEKDRNAGWNIDPKFLGVIAKTTDEMESDFSSSMEQVELVLMSLERLGWKFEAPNAELSGPRPLAAEGSRSNDVLGHGGK